MGFHRFQWVFKGFSRFLEDLLYRAFNGFRIF